MADAEATELTIDGMPAGWLRYDVPEEVVFRVNNPQAREVFRVPAGADALAYAAARIAQLDRENAALREALEAEWRIAHAERCDKIGLPPSHAAGCRHPYPTVLMATAE